MKWQLVGLALAIGLSGCGVDGPPVRPEPEPAKTTVGLSGTVKVGIAGGSG